MAGEMTVADLAEWPIHQAVADGLSGVLRPFDQYQGPYIEWQGRKIFIHPMTMWRALVLGNGWVCGFCSRQAAMDAVWAGLQSQKAIHPELADFVAADECQYLQATDTRSQASTPAYPNMRGVEDLLVDAIKGMK